MMTIVEAPAFDAELDLSVPGPNGRDLLASQEANESSARTYPRRLPVAIAEASGSYVTDVDGRVYIDFLTGAGVLALGHNHPALVAAVQDQLTRLTHGLDFPTPVREEFKRNQLAMLPDTIRDDMKIHFCGPTGSDAVEAAIKLCKKATGRGGIVAFQGSYHGSTQGAMSLTSETHPKEDLHNLLPGVHFAPYAYCHRCPLGLRPDTCATNCAQLLANTLHDTHGGVPKPAAIIMELAQGGRRQAPLLPALLSDSPTLIDVPGQSTSVPSSDAPTMVDVPGSDPSDSPTMVDALGSDAPTMFDGSPSPGKPAPPRIQRPQSNPSMLQPGAILGQRYEILQMLGEGGMGAVYKARDRELNRMVALKVIRPELAGSQAIIDRFKQELLLSTQVTHKNVIRIYDLGEAEGMKFITMEYVEGEDLRALIQKKGKLAPEEAVEIMQQVCRALEAAHSVGVIHRDLKPQNIMRDKTGRILVMDFGLARTLDGDGMTQTGALVGTMDYMSPEQALGKELDQRSDLFALGLIFYELLTGEMPFKADSALASLIKRTQERATPVSSHDAPSRALSNIVSKCLERDLKLRYQSRRRFSPISTPGRADAPPQPCTSPAASGPGDEAIPGTGSGPPPRLVWRRRLRDPRQIVQPSARPNRARRFAGHSAVSQRVRRPSLDWLGSSLADMLSTDVGQSSQVAHGEPQRLHQIFTDLRIASTTVLDPTAIRVWLISATPTGWSGDSTPSSATRFASMPRFRTSRTIARFR